MLENEVRSSVAELSIFYCEEAVSLLSWCSMDEEGYYVTLVHMFEQAQITVERLPASERASFYERLDTLRSAAGKLGLGVKDAFDELGYSRMD